MALGRIHTCPSTGKSLAYDFEMHIDAGGTFRCPHCLMLHASRPESAIFQATNNTWDDKPTEDDRQWH